MLTVYVKGEPRAEAVDILGDTAGLTMLVSEFQNIIDNPGWDHEHFVTETGGGYGVTLDETPLAGWRVVHYLDIHNSEHWQQSANDCP